MNIHGSYEEKGACWDRLTAYEFDDPEYHLTFTSRLARENGWSEDFASRVIEEYRRFCFLAIHAGHPVTPSDAVDQVWHLHLSYSRDYWERFCPEILQKPLHHGPTQGGEEEGEKYREWYEKTLESYARFFGEPPRTIWPLCEERFARADQFIRVNRGEVYIVDRSFFKWGPQGKPGMIVIASVALVFTMALPVERPVLLFITLCFGIWIAGITADVLSARYGHYFLGRRRREKSGGDMSGGGCGGSGCGSGCGGCGG